MQKLNYNAVENVDASFIKNVHAPDEETTTTNVKWKCSMMVFGGVLLVLGYAGVHNAHTLGHTKDQSKVEVAVLGNENEDFCDLGYEWFREPGVLDYEMVKDYGSDSMGNDNLGLMICTLLDDLTATGNASEYVSVNKRFLECDQCKKLCIPEPDDYSDGVCGKVKEWREKDGFDIESICRAMRGADKCCACKGLRPCMNSWIPTLDYEGYLEPYFSPEYAEPESWCEEGSPEYENYDWRVDACNQAKIMNWDSFDPAYMFCDCAVLCQSDFTGLDRYGDPPACNRKGTDDYDFTPEFLRREGVVIWM